MKRELIPLILPLLLLACGRDEVKTPASAAQPAAGTPAHEAAAVMIPAEMPAAMDSDTIVLDSHGAAMGDVALASSSEKISGRVEEVLEGSGFKYLRVRTSSGEVWAAVREGEVRKGDRVTVIGTMDAADFESKTLNRKFERLVFGNLEGAAPTIGPGIAPAAAALATTLAHAAAPANQGETPAAFPPAMMEAIARGGAGGEMPANIPPAMKEALARGGSPHGGTAAMKPEDLTEIKVSRADAPDGKIVQEIWASRAQLSDKSVTVRGKVVKFLPGIMGRNWVHLRDGSGSSENGDHDIILTTSEAVTVGDVVVASGTVRVDKDFGSGYRYPVIIEEARLKR